MILSTNISHLICFTIAQHGNNIFGFFCGFLPRMHEAKGSWNQPRYKPLSRFKSNLEVLFRHIHSPYNLENGSAKRAFFPPTVDYF